MAWPLENKNKLSKSCIDPLNIQLCYSKNNFGFNVTSEKIQKWKGEYLHWSNKIQSDVDPQIFIITSLSVLFHFQSRLKLPSEFIIKIKLKSLISSSYENQVFNLVNLSTWCFFYIIQDSNNIAEHFCSDSLKKKKKKKFRPPGSQTEGTNPVNLNCWHGASHYGTLCSSHKPDMLQTSARPNNSDTLPEATVWCSSVYRTCWQFSLSEELL